MATPCSSVGSPPAAAASDYCFRATNLLLFPFFTSSFISCHILQANIIVAAAAEKIALESVFHRVCV